MAITINRFLSGYNYKLLLIMVGFVLLNSMLVVRLWSLQLLHGRAHSEAIARQSVRRIRLEPNRGRIFSYDGEVLADNRPTVNVYFHLHEMRHVTNRGQRLTLDSVKAEIDRAADLIGREATMSTDDVLFHVKNYAALPMLAFTDLTPYEQARLCEAMPEVSGLEIRTESRRVYPQGAVGAHLLGFVGSRWATDEEKDTYNYFLPESTGRMGLELAFNEQLSGRGGMSVVLVDPAGFTFTELSKDEPEAGQDLQLNLDARAQRIAQSLMQGRKGALVMMDVQTGAVRAMVSSPTYDLGSMSGSYFGELAGNPERPLMNRALSADNMPGSIAKPLVALSVLESGAKTPEDIVHCPGYIMLGRTRINCWNHWGHGDVHVIDALQTSCNAYLIDAGVAAGIDNLHETFASAGLGRPTGIELRAIGDAGILPGKDELRARNGRSWQTVDTAFVSIGQGFIGVSPLQAAAYTAAIANGGRLLRPQLVYALFDPKGRLQRVMGPDVQGQLKGSAENLEMIREGMHRAIHGDRPTAKEANTPSIDLAGKTGTAEVGPRNNRRKNTWFICFGPFKDPKYAMCVLVEDGASGGKSAAPIAREFFDLWLAAQAETASLSGD